MNMMGVAVDVSKVGVNGTNDARIMSLRSKSTSSLLSRSMLQKSGCDPSRNHECRREGVFVCIPITAVGHL